MAKDLFILQASSGNQDFCSDDLTLWNQIIALIVLSFSMGIQKIGRHVSGVSSDCRQVSYSSNVDNMVLEENQASGTCFEDDSDDCEFEEVRCELGVVEVTNLLDLNTYPENGFLLCKEVNPEPVTHQLSRQTKSVKSRRENA